MGKFPTFLIPFFPFTRLQPVELGFRLATFERVCEEDFAFAPPSPPAPPRFPRATRHSRSLAIADLPAPSLPASTTSWPPPRRFRARSAAVLAGDSHCPRVRVTPKAPYSAARPVPVLLRVLGSRGLARGTSSSQIRGSSFAAGSSVVAAVVARVVAAVVPVVATRTSSWVVVLASTAVTPRTAVWVGSSATSDGGVQGSGAYLGVVLYV